MVVNKKLLQFISQKGLEEKMALMFLFGVLIDKDFGGNVEGMLDYLQDNDLVDSGLISVLLTQDEDGNPKFIYPLFEEETSNTGSLWQKFFDRMIEEGILGSRGHLNNPQDYIVISGSDAEKYAFDAVCTSMSIDTEKALRVITNYYRTTKPAFKLENYMYKGFQVDCFSE